MNKKFETERFGMRIRPEEKIKLAKLAETLNRSQSDTIRILINDAYLSQERENKPSKRKPLSLSERTKTASKVMR